MPPSFSRSQLLRRLRAAVVLAAVYTLGVIACFGLLAAIDDWRLYIDDFRTTVTPFGVLFGIAFVILGFARRVGFIALWVLLCSLWFLLLRNAGYELPFEFVKWSVFGLPLYLITFVAVGHAIPLNVGTRKVRPLLVVGGLWIMLAVTGFMLRNYAYSRHLSRITEGEVSGFERVNLLGWVLWAPAPFVIAGVCVAAMWVGSRGGQLQRA